MHRNVTFVLPGKPPHLQVTEVASAPSSISLLLLAA